MILTKYKLCMENPSVIQQLMPASFCRSRALSSESNYAINAAYILVRGHTQASINSLAPTDGLSWNCLVSRVETEYKSLPRLQTESMFGLGSRDINNSRAICMHRETHAVS